MSFPGLVIGLLDKCDIIGWVISANSADQFLVEFIGGLKLRRSFDFSVIELLRH